MKKIEDVILENSPEIKAKLFEPAKKAFEAPDTGITIIKPAAYRVIKDCAETTLLFLPIEIFLKYKSPIQSLKGKITREQIIDLYNRTTADYTAKILFQLILETCPKSTPQLALVNKATITSSLETDDPYGAYGDILPHSEDSTKSNVELIITAYT